jgi:hypothetical protein
MAENSRTTMSKNARLSSRAAPNAIPNTPQPNPSSATLDTTTSKPSESLKQLPSWLLRRHYRKSLRSCNAKRQQWAHRDYMSQIHEHVVHELEDLTERYEGVDACPPLPWKIYSEMSGVKRKEWLIGAKKKMGLDLEEGEGEKGFGVKKPRRNSSGRGWCVLLPRPRPERGVERSRLYEDYCKGLEGSPSDSSSDDDSRYGRARSRTVDISETDRIHSPTSLPHGRIMSPDFSSDVVSTAGTYSDLEVTETDPLLHSGEYIPPYESSRTEKLKGFLKRRLSIGSKKEEDGATGHMTKTNFKSWKGCSKIKKTRKPAVYGAHDPLLPQDERSPPYDTGRSHRTIDSDVPTSNGRSPCAYSTHRNAFSLSRVGTNWTGTREALSQLERRYSQHTVASAQSLGRYPSSTKQPDGGSDTSELSEPELSDPELSKSELSKQDLSKQDLSMQELSKQQLSKSSSPPTALPEVLDTNQPIHDPYLTRTPSYERLREKWESRLQRMDAKVAEQTRTKITQERENHARVTLAHAHTIKKAEAKPELITIAKPPRLQRKTASRDFRSSSAASATPSPNKLELAQESKKQELQPQQTAVNTPWESAWHQLEPFIPTSPRPIAVNTPWESAWHQLKPFIPTSTSTSTTSLPYLEHDHTPASSTYSLTQPAADLISTDTLTPTKTPPLQHSTPPVRTSSTHQHQFLNLNPNLNQNTTDMLTPPQRLKSKVRLDLPSPADSHHSINSRPFTQPRSYPSPSTSSSFNSHIIPPRRPVILQHPQPRHPVVYKLAEPPRSRSPSPPHHKREKPAPSEIGGTQPQPIPSSPPPSSSSLTKRITFGVNNIVGCEEDVGRNAATVADCESSESGWYSC